MVRHNILLGAGWASTAVRCDCLRHHNNSGAGTALHAGGALGALHLFYW